ncbi:uracil-DNA glycosylase family protein [Pedococcus sp. 5OH_020]|uniref:uracil-DNA glycosylase family protein n=1 Tax=Pedococcus sp. 5OH_020 TaxID=2989814 RepID=UPI0022E9D7A8|nr:uracil-DNA glycosylase family protein [Pedococcus sp. 5OH_020]
MSETLEKVKSAIITDPDNAWATDQGWQPLYSAHVDARVVIVGQAPGRRAQLSGIPWDDPSGVTLRGWLGLTAEEFYDPRNVALLPMDFFYPGKGQHGDLPPRPYFATKWHPQLLEQMPHVALTLLIGQYAQRHYLRSRVKATLTETVHAYQEYLPRWFPLVHPSPLNFRWQARNPWFADLVLPELRQRVAVALDCGQSARDVKRSN